MMNILVGIKTTIAIGCTIDNQNNLYVPSDGCTLPFTEDRQINIETLTLNGPLMIDSHNHLKYKNIVCVEDKSEILIKSNYEKIVVEDINSNSCLNPCKLNLQFDSKSKNSKYTIEQINNMQELNLKENPITLFKGVKILISSISGNVEFAEVSKVKDKKIILKNKLKYNHQTYIYQDTEENAFQYPEIIVLDENRAVFKNNCFIVKPKKSLDLDYSTGGMFIDMKEFQYEDQQQKFQIKQSIFIQTEGVKTSCIKKIKSMIEQTVFIGISNSEIYLYDYPDSLSFINIKNFMIINNGRINNSQFINFDGIIKTEENEYFQGMSNFFQNSQIIFEVQKDFDLKQSKFISSGFKQTELSKTQLVSFIDSYFSGKPLDLSFINAKTIKIDGCIFDGKGLKNAILVQGQKLIMEIYILVSNSVFNEFVDLDTSLITTSSKNPKFLSNDDIMDPKEFIYTIQLNRNSYNLKLNDAQKIINIPQSAIVFGEVCFYPFKIEKLLPQNLFKIENSIFIQQKLFEFTQSSFSIDLDEQEKQDGQYFELKSPQSTEKYDLGKSYYFFDKQERYFGQLFDKNNKSFTPSKLLLSVKVNYKQSITIYLDPEQPVLEIELIESEQNTEGMMAHLMLDGGLYIDFDESSDFLFEIKLNRCQKGQYLSEIDSEKICVNQCKNEETSINNVCQSGQEIDTYYIKDKKYFSCINRLCDTCTNSSDCTWCANHATSNEFCIEPSFQKTFVQENEKMVEKSCPPNCWQCKKQNECEICSLDYVLNQKRQCVDSCKEGQFKVLEESYCDDSCSNMSKCVDCYSNPKIGCKSCQPGYLLQKQGSCIRQCLQNQYFEDGVCKSCHLSCLLCKGGAQKDCLKCNDGFSFKDSICTQIACSQNQFIFNDKCEDCYNKTNSKGCFGPYPHSLTCDKGYYIQFFQDSCKKCNTECQECEFESDNCKVCAEKYILVSGKCISEKNKCQIQDQKCVKCDSNGNECTLCAIGYYLSQGKCMKCDQSCEECSNSSNICIKCPISKYLQGTQCLDNCLQNQYKDDTLRKCINCDQSKCKSCQNLNDECTECEKNLFLEEKKCVSACSKGYKIHDKNCVKQSQKCDQNCIKCDSGTNECTLCTFDHYLSQGKCMKCDQSCEECSSSSNICIKCPISKYLQDTQCLDSCLQNQYKDETLRKCINCDQSKCKSCQNANDECTECENSLFLEEQKCVSSCSNGYRINERKCEKQSSDSSQSDGVVVGIVVGCFVGVILVIVTILGIKRMRIQQKIKKQDQYVVTTNNQLFSCQDVDTKNNLDDEKQIIK